MIVVVRRPAESDGTAKIERSGKAIDRLFGTALTGEAVGRLTPSREDAENETAIVFTTGRTLMMEDHVQLPGGLTRVARLYLPFADAAGRVDGVVVGIARAA